MNYAMVNILTNIVENLIVVAKPEDFTSDTHFITPTQDVAGIGDIYDPVSSTFIKTEKPPMTISREDMDKLSMVEFRRRLRSIRTETIPEGIYEEDILDKIALIEDKEQRAEARDYFLYAQYIERTNPWIDNLGAMFNLTPEEIDGFWVS